MSQGERSPDFYAVLGVSQSANQEEIDKARRELAKQYHPDKLGHVSAAVRKLAEEKLKEINIAYDVIGNPRKRGIYDNERFERKRESERKRAEERAQAEKEAKHRRIRDLYESGDFKGALNEAKLLFGSFPDDADCRNSYAALLYEWGKRLAEKGMLEESASQLKLAAELILDEKLKVRILADLELLRTARFGPAAPPRTAPKAPVSPAVPPTITAEEAFSSLAGGIAMIIRWARLAWKLGRPQIIAALLLIFAVGIGFRVVSLHKSLMAGTTLSFVLSVDGEDTPAVRVQGVTVDGKPLTSGRNIALGRHRISIRLPGTEPFERSFWTFYGKNDLGRLQLEPSKGSLSITVSPSPAKIIVRRESKMIQQGDAPLKLDRLPVGDYSLLIRRGEYEESYSTKIERQSRTEVNVQLGLGSAQLSSQPPDADFDLSGNRRHWQGKLPTRVEDVPEGDYSLLIRRGEYQEVHSVRIERKREAQVDIELNLGSVHLTSEPADAEFELSGNNQRWQGTLPSGIDDVPVGNYRFTARRKGWEVSESVNVNRGKVTAHKIEFPYGSIQVNSEPPGMAVSTNGVEIGRTPATLRELKPGRYALTVTDGENDLVESLSVGPNEAVEHNFVFHYGTVLCSSIPNGAIVIRRGKVVGRTPLTLERIPTEPTELELRLEGYASTNFPILAREGLTAGYDVKLFSRRYLAAMKGARQALEANEFELARQCTATAIESDPGDTHAASLLAEINQKASQWEKELLERKRLAAEEAARAERLAAEEIAKRTAAEFASIPILDPETIINGCWRAAERQSEDFSKLSAFDAAKSNPAAVPVAAATDVVVKGIEAIVWPIHKLKAKKVPRFDQGRFSAVYRNNIYRYYSTISSVDVKTGMIAFSPGGRADRRFVVSARFQHEMPPYAARLKRGASVWVVGRLSDLAEVGSANSLVLDTSTVYASGFRSGSAAAPPSASRSPVGGPATPAGGRFNAYKPPTNTNGREVNTTEGGVVHPYNQPPAPMPK